ncbi:hypothetical protein APY94_00140 [Thermococcus celericrescens]|uniref:Uncharacterized protein n=1 Tax=Thermococcus celericrescens TaxID=227598 RepID=A0A100XZX0_9EURY|nr:hypothetical protein [Thermococcus celericrescens]KUH34820.1 hypothetical protein APY94_00140 [Thermococcus celericrescens]
MTPSDASTWSRIVSGMENYALAEVSFEELGLDAIADRYFTPDLMVGVDIRKVKVLKVSTAEGQEFYWVKGFMPVTRELLDKSHKRGILADVMVKRAAENYAVLTGKFNGKDIFVSTYVVPEEWFINVLLSAVKAFLDSYGERGLIVLDADSSKNNEKGGGVG